MRITAGKLKGHKLQALANNRIRPTGERGRQALFNMLCHDGALYAGAPGPALVGGRFLDVCAGTGANGIEALSRGARSAVFMDRDLRCARRNLAGIDLERLHAEVEWIEGDACTPPPTCQPAEVLFLDPPYGQGLVAPILSALQKAGWLAEHGLAVAETARHELWTPPSGWRLVDDRRYGKTRLTFLRWNKG